MDILVLYQGESLLGEEYDDIVRRLSEAIGISECEVRNTLQSSLSPTFGYRMVRFQNVPNNSIDIINNIRRLSCTII